MGLENQTNGWILMVNQADPTVHSKYVQTYTDINAPNCAHLEPRSELQKGSTADAWHPKTMPCGANESHAKRVQSMNIYIYIYGNSELWTPSGLPGKQNKSCDPFSIRGWIF